VCAPQHVRRVRDTQGHARTHAPTYAKHSWHSSPCRCLQKGEERLCGAGARGSTTKKGFPVPVPWPRPCVPMRGSYRGHASHRRARPRGGPPSARRLSRGEQSCGQRPGQVSVGWRGRLGGVHSRDRLGATPAVTLHFCTRACESRCEVAASPGASGCTRTRVAAMAMRRMQLAGKRLSTQSASAAARTSARATSAHVCGHCPRRACCPCRPPPPVTSLWECLFCGAAAAAAEEVVDTYVVSVCELVQEGGREAGTVARDLVHTQDHLACMARIVRPHPRHRRAPGTRNAHVPTPPRRKVSTSMQRTL
jgi:hypothetical protein